MKPVHKGQPIEAEISATEGRGTIYTKCLPMYSTSDHYRQVALMPLYVTVKTTCLLVVTNAKKIM